MSSRIGIIDIGSNSSRLNVFEVADDGSYRELGFERVPTALAGCVDASNAVSSRGIRLAASSAAALVRCAQQQFDAATCHVFATASLRGRANEHEVCCAVKDACSFDVQVIDGFEEARCGYASLAKRYNPSCAVMADVGGGSTEIVAAHGKDPFFVQSLDLGSRALSARFVADAWPTKDEADAMSAYIASKLAACADIAFDERPVLFGIGGTARALAGVASGDKALFTSGLREQVERFCPERLDTMAAGALIFKGLFEVFEPCRFTASDANCREGYLIRHVIGGQHLLVGFAS